MQHVRTVLAAAVKKYLTTQICTFESAGRTFLLAEHSAAGGTLILFFGVPFEHS